MTAEAPQRLRFRAPPEPDGPKIRNDPKLSPAQKSEVLKIVQEEQQKTLLEILGKETFERYEQDQAE